MNTKVKDSVKQGRSDWLDKLTVSGDWDQVRKLRNGVAPAQGRMRNLHGELVNSEDRAETYA